jgi:hypothetical protein
VPNKEPVGTPLGSLKNNDENSYENISARHDSTNLENG